LDSSRTFRIGECNVTLEDVSAIHSEWRLGARLVMKGIASARLKHLNGLFARVCEHKRHGFPCFVQKGRDSSAKFKLNICVRWEDPSVDSSGALLLEPWQLSPPGPMDDEVDSWNLLSARSAQSECTEGSEEAWDEPPPTLQVPEPSQELVPRIKVDPFFKPVPSGLFVPTSDNTLLTAPRRGGKHTRYFQETAPPPEIMLNSPREPRFHAVPGVPASCSNGLLGFISCLVGARPRQLELGDADFETVCKMTSTIAVDEVSPQRSPRPALLPIPEDSQTIPVQTESEVSAAMALPEKGDLVILGRKVQPEFQLSWAVVRVVEGSSCSVTVLDSSRSFSIGEYNTKLSDVLPVNQDFRVGARLVIQALQGTGMKHLNGLTGIVRSHKRYGHPIFLARPGSTQDKLWLHICLQLDDPEKAGLSAVLLESRFLAPKSPDSKTTSPTHDKTNHVSDIPEAKKPGSGYEKSNSLASTASGSTAKQSSLNSTSSRTSHDVNGSNMPASEMLREISELRENLKSLASVKKV